MKPEEPQAPHRWLQRLVGEWTYEFEVPMKPGDPPTKFTGTESVRAVGELWIVGEARGTMPDGTPSTSLLTLGYDISRQKFVGTWLGSMMTHLWTYEGDLDGDALALNTKGPNMMEPGTTARYQEVVELKPDGTRTFSSYMLGDDGTRQPMMSMQYRRVK